MKRIEELDKKYEVLFWSIALPGFGQLLNRKYVKGIILIAIEFLINVKGFINVVIISSFLGKMNQAIDDADFQWIMFYPCVYLFAIWDAYRDAGGGSSPFMYLPFVFSAYFGTIGVIYSASFKIYGKLIGPVFLPIIMIFFGCVVGFILRKIIILTLRTKEK